MSRFEFAVIVFNVLGLSSLAMATPEFREPVCPMVYKPATCRYEDIAAYGSNRCFAYAALQQKLRMLDLKVDPQAIRCHEGDLALLRTRESVAS
jgi:hypothetical protein